jgi:hypothetical protein
MEQRKWIHPRVAPFNEFYLGSCYTQAYVPAVAALGVSAEKFIANNYSYFQKDGERLFIRSSYLDTQTVFNDRFGLMEESLCHKVEKLPQFLVEQLRESRLCICRSNNPHAIDVESGKLANGSGEGVIHWLLVYGYDLDSQHFFVLEHRTNFAALYRPMEIPFDELERAYSASFSQSNEADISLTLLWKDVENEEVITLSELIHQRERSRRKIAPDSTVALFDFYGELAESNLRAEPGQLLILLNKIIAILRTEAFILRGYGRENLFEDLIKYNNLLRSFAIKSIMGKMPKPENYVKYCGAVQHLLVAYKELYDEILSC